MKLSQVNLMIQKLEKTYCKKKVNITETILIGYNYTQITNYFSHQKRGNVAVNIVKIYPVLIF